MLQILPEQGLTIYSRVAFDTEVRAREMVNYLLAHPRFAPDRAGSYEPLRNLTSERVDHAVASLVNRAQQERSPDRVSASHIFERKRKPACLCSVNWERLPHVAFSQSWYTVEGKFIQDERHLDEWLTFAAGLIERHEAWFARYALREESNAKNFLKWRITGRGAPSQKYWVAGSSRGIGMKLENGIPGIYWGNYFGPFYVDWFGRGKFDDLPCVEKRWLETGGIFFTTAPTPFGWNTPEARQMQQSVKEHLGKDAFFDYETVFARVRRLEPIPDNFEPELFQSSRRLPDFPFTVMPPHIQSRPVAEQLARARQAFEGQGYTPIEEGERMLLFRDDTGGILRVTVGKGGSIEYLPPQ